MRDQISRVEKCGTGKCIEYCKYRTGKWRTENTECKMQAWKMEDRKYGVGNAGLENAGPKMQEWKTQD